MKVKEQRELLKTLRVERLSSRFIPKSNIISVMSYNGLENWEDSLGLLGNNLQRNPHTLKKELPNIKNPNLKKSYEREIELQKKNLGYIDRRIKQIKNKKKVINRLEKKRG